MMRHLLLPVKHQFKHTSLMGLGSSFMTGQTLVLDGGAYLF
jgi:hypothetical protein